MGDKFLRTTVMVSWAQIRSFDVWNYFMDLGIRLHQTGDEYFGDCIFCGAKDKFYINSVSKACICHKCGFRSRELQWLIEKVSGVSAKEANRIIGGTSDEVIVRKRNRLVEEDPIEIDLPAEFMELKFPTTPKSQKYWDYVVRERGLLPSTVTKYQLGYCARGKFKQRIIVPVYWDGRLVSWVGRHLRNDVDKPKITPPGNHQSKYLFNLDRIWGNSDLCLVEGPFDMLKAPDILCASFGKHLSSAQFNLIREMSPNKVVVMYDDDAMKDTLKTAARINDITKCFVATLPPGKDPGNLSEGEIRMHIKHAEPYKETMLMNYMLKEAASK